MPCSPGRPAHPRSRSFFRAAATLALVAGGLSGSLSTQAQASDFTNASGTTIGTQNFTGNTYVNINNSGTIQGSGAFGIKVSGATINSLNNSGTISTLPNLGASQVYIDNHSSIGTFTNSGTITGGGWAITLNGTVTINTLSNTGQIIGFDAINLNSGTTGNRIDVLNNSGTIQGRRDDGTGRYGILVMGNQSIGVINNSGTITGVSGGIVNNNVITTINLLNGSVINGGISNSGTIGTLNVYKTVTNANFDTASLIPTIAGNQPGITNLYLTTPANCKFVTVGGRTVGIDTSGFGANGQAIRQVTGSISRLANTNGLIQSIGAKIASQNADPYAMTSDLCADGAPAPAGQTGNSDFWIRGFTGRNKVDATAASVDYINTYSGGAVGIERDWSEGLRAGAFIGAGSTDNNLGGGLGGSAADLIFMGGYATKVMGTLFAKVGLTGGRGNNTGTRNIAAGTPETALADYDSWYLSPEASVGKVYDLGQRLGGTFTMTPVLTVRYVYAHQDGYTETGATNNLTMNDSHSTTVEERAELKFSYATETFGDYRVKLNASVGGLGQQNGGGAMSGALLGAPLSFATPGNQNFTGFIGGLGFEISRGKYTFTAYGDYVRLDGGNTDISANAVFSVKF